MARLLVLGLALTLLFALAPQSFPRAKAAEPQKKSLKSNVPRSKNAGTWTAIALAESGGRTEARKPKAGRKLKTR
jgi:hypothetical protein